MIAESVNEDESGFCLAVRLLSGCQLTGIVWGAGTAYPPGFRVEPIPVLNLMPTFFDARHDESVLSLL